MYNYISKPISELTAHPRNEEFFDRITTDNWELLKRSIVERGLINPIVITQDNVIVSGHARVEVFKFLRLAEIPCIVNEYNTEDDVLCALIESNIAQRGIGNTNPIKNSMCLVELERIYKAHGSVKTQQEIADKLNISMGTYTRTKRLAELPQDCKDMIESGNISASAGARIISLLSEEEQIELIKSLDVTKKYTNEQILRRSNEIHQAMQDEMALTLENKDMEIQKLKIANQKLANQDEAYVQKAAELDKANQKARDLYELSQTQNKTISKLQKELTENSATVKAKSIVLKHFGNMLKTLPNEIKMVIDLVSVMDDNTLSQVRELFGELENCFAEAMEQLKPPKRTTHGNLTVIK